MTLTEEDRAKIKEFNAERDAVLSQDFELHSFLGFLCKWSTEAPSNEHVAEIMFHKARTAVVNLPEELRRVSREWLKSHGYEHWGDEPQ